MRALLLGLLLTIGTVKAFPQSQSDFVTSEERLVTGSIVNAIEEVAQSIRDAGYDPVDVDRVEDRIILLPLLVNINTFIDELKITGLSNIAVNRMDYGVLLSRLTFDVSLPEIFLSIGDSGAELAILGRGLELGQLKGQLSIKQIRIKGEVRVNVGIITGISVRSLSLDFSLGGIDSQLDAKVLRLNVSDNLNTLLGERIPELIIENEKRINEALESVAWDLIALLL